MTTAATLLASLLVFVVVVFVGCCCCCSWILTKHRHSLHIDWLLLITSLLPCATLCLLYTHDSSWLVGW